MIDKHTYIKELDEERKEMLQYIRDRGDSVDIEPDTDRENSCWEKGYAKACEDVIFNLRRRVK